MPPAAPVPNLPLTPWGPPLAAQTFDPPVYPRASQPLPPQVQAFGPRPTKTGLQPWMLIAGAVLVALLAFAITRAFIS